MLSTNFPDLSSLVFNTDYVYGDYFVSYASNQGSIIIGSKNLVVDDLGITFEDGKLYFIRCYQMLPTFDNHFEVYEVVMDGANISTTYQSGSDTIVNSVTYPFIVVESELDNSVLFDCTIDVYSSGVVVDNIGTSTLSADTLQYEGYFPLVDISTMTMDTNTFGAFTKKTFLEVYLLMAVQQFGLNYVVGGGSSTVDLSSVIDLINTNTGILQSFISDQNIAVQNNIENSIGNIYPFMSDSFTTMQESINGLSISLSDGIDFTTSLNGMFGSLKDGVKVQILSSNGVDFDTQVYTILRSTMVFADDKLYAIAYTLSDDSNQSITYNTIDRMRVYVEPIGA